MRSRGCASRPKVSPLWRKDRISLNCFLSPRTEETETRRSANKAEAAAPRLWVRNRLVLRLGARGGRGRAGTAPLKAPERRGAVQVRELSRSWNGAETRRGECSCPHLPLSELPLTFLKVGPGLDISCARSTSGNRWRWKRKSCKTSSSRSEDQFICLLSQQRDNRLQLTDLWWDYQALGSEREFLCFFFISFFYFSL